MKHFYLFLILIFCSIITAQAQKNGSVKGIAFDTIAKQPVSAATVSVLDKADSSLISFTMTGTDGRFEVKGLANGNYRLLITHVNYHNFNKYFSINDSSKVADLTNLPLSDKNKILEEVVITAEAPPITLINDTIQYNAGSFKVQPNANVEDLLKKLPGVKVEKDGTIKAQGEKVQKVLVDGKEFFGNDPKIATKNLPADAIDKVQVYDKQSDQAQLTGFEDGSYEKTINLKLKKDKKKGAFGKVTAGAGTRERYENRFNVNSFKGARQISAIGMANNDNGEGFSFMDILNFTGELARMQRAGGGNMNINISGDQAAGMGISNGTGSGITTASGGGINYNNIIGKKLDLQSNFFTNRQNPVRESFLQRQYLLPVTSFYSQNAITDNVNNNHRLNLNLLWQLDSMNSIRFTPSIAYQQANNNSTSNYKTLSAAQSLINDGFSNNNSINEGYTFRNELSWRKKFARRGRTFSLTLQGSFNESDGSGSLSSINNFYDAGGVINRRDTLNQQSIANEELKAYTARMVYTEPLGKKSLLELSVSNSNSRNASQKLTYDFNRANSKYDKLNNLLSNDFLNDYGFTNAGIRIRTQRKKYNYAVGASWQQANLKGQIVTGIKDSVISQRFQNILPNARFQYNISKFKSFTATYNTSTNQPTMQQLQPVPDVSNPLNIREGNPELKQEFTQTVQANLNLMSPFTNKNLFAFITFQTTRNKIVNYDSINLQTGVRKSKPVNVSGVYNINTNISYSRPVKFLKGTVELSAAVGYNRSKQLINDVSGKAVLNNIRVLNLGPELRFDINPTQKINVAVGTAISYNKTKFSLQSQQPTQFLSQEYNTSFDWELPKGFFFGTSFTYTINSQRAAGFNLAVPIWNASLSKQMLKFNRGELKLSVKDLLNKNLGISRNANNNFIDDSRVINLRRFFLLSFTYSLSKAGLQANQGGGGMRIITR